MAHHRIRRGRGTPRLLHYRLALGLTQAEVVERLHELAWTHHPDEPFSLDRASYARWETGERRPRSKVARDLLSRLFSATEHELGLRSMRQLLLPGSAAGVDRAESLALLAAAPPPLDLERLRVVRHGRLSVDPKMLADLERITAMLGSQRYELSPVSVLPMVHAHVTTLRELLSHAGSNRAWRELARLAGYTAVIAGQLWDGLAKLSESTACYAFAEALAREADDDRVVAGALGSRSLRHTVARLAGHEGAHRQALELLDGANDRLDRASDSPLRPWLLSCRAWEQAAIGNERSAHQDLETAERAFVATDWGVDTFLSIWGPRLSDVGFLAYRGQAALLGTSPAEGLDLLAAAATRVAPNAMMRIPLLVDLAVAWAEREDVERACDLMAGAIDQAGGAKVTVFTTRIKHVRHRVLSRFATVGAVKALDERLVDLIG